MARKAITAKNASAIGPYSHGIDADGLIFLSGQTPVDPANGQVVPGGIAEQTSQCFKNLSAVLDAANITLDNVVKVNVFLTDMNDFAGMNAVYKEQFTQPYPARSTVGVAALPMGVKVEIELIAKR